MDQPVKTLVNLFTLFLGVFLLITIVTFGIAVNKAEDVLSTVTTYVETVGINEEVINAYAEETNTIINVTSTDDDSIYSGGEKKRYIVEVTFSHQLAWFNLENTNFLKPTLSLRKVTRAVEH